MSVVDFDQTPSNYPSSIFAELCGTTGDKAWVSYKVTPSQTSVSPHESPKQ